ncbi:MAG: hypothetical protein WBE37_07185 [Bryobacteraceae bacterium]
MPLASPPLSLGVEVLEIGVEKNVVEILGTVFLGVDTGLNVTLKPVKLDLSSLGDSALGLRALAAFKEPG